MAMRILSSRLNFVQRRRTGMLTSFMKRQRSIRGQSSSRSVCKHIYVYSSWTRIRVGAPRKPAGAQPSTSLRYGWEVARRRCDEPVLIGERYPPPLACVYEGGGGMMAAPDGNTKASPGRVCMRGRWQRCAAHPKQIMKHPCLALGREGGGNGGGGWYWRR